MIPSQRFLVAVTLLNATLAAVSLTQFPHANAASEVAPVLRGRMLEIVDDRGRPRASIVVHPAEAGARADSVVLRLINPDGQPAVKLAASDTSVGLAMIAEQGNYIQVFTDGVKVTKGGQQKAQWP